MRRALLAGTLFLLPACGSGGEGSPGLPAWTTTTLVGAVTAYDVVQWPVAGAVSSPFGPRLRASAGFAYEFHPGLDIPGTLGDPVVAAADGTVNATWTEGDLASPYPNGGNVVILQHAFDTPFPLHGMSHGTWYSLYLHLATIGVGAPGTAIAKGAAVGTMGQSGTTTFTHLHFEVRVGTLCSRAYQLANPGAGCASYFGSPQDPHVNPLNLLGYADLDTFQAEVVGVSPLRIRIRANRAELDLNEVKAVSGLTTKVVNFDARGGLDPVDLDNPDYGGVLLSPAAFDVLSPLYELTLTFSTLATFDVIELRDVWGKGLKLTRL